LVHAEVILVPRLAVCLCQHGLHLGAAAHGDNEEQAGLVRLQNAIKGSPEILGAGSGMVKHDQAFALAGPLEHSQTILDRNQGCS
jgi:hypothetical protein